MKNLPALILVLILVACASGTMEVERCLPGELGCKKLTYSKYYRGEQMTQDGALRLIAAAALDERDIPLKEKILYSVGAKAEGADAGSGNIKIYANNTTGHPVVIQLTELQVIMTDNIQRDKLKAHFELKSYETRALAALTKNIEDFSTKFIIKAVLRYNDREEELQLELNRLSVEQLKQIQTLERPL